MRLTATSGCEVLKTNLLLIAGLCIIDLAKLVLSHLHHLALVLDLPLGKFEGLAGHCITWHDLRGVLTGHKQIFLRLFIFKVGVRGGRLLQLVAVEVHILLHLMMLLLLHSQQFTIRGDAVALVADLTASRLSHSVLLSIWVMHLVVTDLLILTDKFRVVISTAKVHIAISG